MTGKNHNIPSREKCVGKGKLISKCPIGVFKLTKKTSVRISALAPKKRFFGRFEDTNRIF